MRPASPSRHMPTLHPGDCRLEPACCNQTTAQPVSTSCSFVDGGGNPDTFTADVFRASLAANQAAKGKVLAVR